jgi:hypothetical protein
MLISFFQSFTKKRKKRIKKIGIVIENLMNKKAAVNFALIVANFP